MNFDFSYVDIAFKNGSVITVDPDDSIAEAVGIKGNKIVFVGSNEDLDKIIDEKTKVYDLKGRTLMPGIIDSHIHPFLVGMLNKRADSPIISLFGPDIASLADIKYWVDEAKKVKKPGEWISMWGYEVPNLKENRDPTLEELDAWAPDNPLQCQEGSGHMSMYNTLAFNTIGVYTAEDAKKFPPGDVEVKDGKLTGRFFGVTSFLLWSKVAYTPKDMRLAVEIANDQWIAKGLTSIHDMGAFDKPCYHAMQKLANERVFKPRVYMALHSVYGKPFSKDDNDHLMALGFLTGLGNEYFRLGTSKFMIDGGSAGPSCYTREPYDHNPDMRREKAWEEDEVADYICLLNRHELQASAHAIGDGAVEYMVKGYEKAFAEDPDKEAFKARRHRIEHCTLTDQDLIDRMAKMNICPSVNAGIPAKNGVNYERFYGKRNDYFGALRSMLDAGLKPSLQSDAPSGPYGFEAIDGCVNRIDRVHGNVVCNQKQCVSVLEAIRIATLYGAYGSYEEDIKGSLEVGKLADMIVCDRDILAMPKTDLYKVQVDLTMIDGEVVFTREGAE